MDYNSLMSLPSKKAQESIQIRLAAPADLPSIVKIYNQAVPTHQSTANTTPYTAEGRRDWFMEHKPEKRPIFVATVDDQLVGWCSLSYYRPGRMALRFTAEISYYVDSFHQGQGVGSSLIQQALQVCPSLGIKNVVAVVIDRNEGSRRLLEKMGFQQWGFLPRVLDFDGQECGEYYYGKRVTE
jgi:L-amino acid N-acyltransferase YncA